MAQTLPGQKLYSESCQACHQENGLGLAGAFPPLGEHITQFLEVEGGRDYLIKALLYGLEGEVEIEGMTYNGKMPAWSALSDESLAAILNYVLRAWDNETLLAEDFEDISIEEIAAARESDLSSVEALALRPQLEVEEP